MKKIKVIGKKLPKVDPHGVARRLGAQEVKEPKGRMALFVRLASFWRPSLRRKI